MDPPTLMNEGSYRSSAAAASAAAAAQSSFNLSEIWPFPVNGGGGGGGLRRGAFGVGDLSQFGGGGGGGSSSELMGRVEEQERSQSRRKGKRREVIIGGGAEEEEEEDGGKTVSTSSIGNAMNDSDRKRLRLSAGSRDENRSSKGDGDRGSSGKVGGGGGGAEQSSKPTTEPPKDYIHVRARRGQATDSHSLAERARREKISERMKILQDLVPGCNKVIGKALVLDEIINYIQSLQRQVEFLSMKLEAVNSRMNLGMDGYPSKDFGQQAFDPSDVAYGSQPPREYARGSSPEWLHMQVGGGGGSSFDRQT